MASGPTAGQPVETAPITNQGAVEPPCWGVGPRPTPARSQDNGRRRWTAIVWIWTNHRARLSSEGIDPGLPPTAEVTLDPIIDAALHELTAWVFRSRRIYNLRLEKREKSLIDSRARDAAIHVFKHLKHHGYALEPREIRAWATRHRWPSGEAQLLSDYAVGVEAGVLITRVPIPLDPGHLMSGGRRHTGSGASTCYRLTARPSGSRRPRRPVHWAAAPCGITPHSRWRQGRLQVGPTADAARPQDRPVMTTCTRGWSVVGPLLKDRQVARP